MAGASCSSAPDPQAWLLVPPLVDEPVLWDANASIRVTSRKTSPGQCHAGVPRESSPVYGVHGVLRRALITGCGRSGTHALSRMLNAAGIHAVHEVGTLQPDSVLVSWYEAGFVRSSLYWRRPSCFAPVIKYHREPLSAITSLANGFTGEGKCSGHQNRFNDAESWKFSSRFVRLPFAKETNHYQNGATCDLSRRQRLVLALHYWIGWNVLGDSVATHTSQIDGANASQVRRIWCGYCTFQGCRCAATTNGSASDDDHKVVPRQGHNDTGSTTALGAALTWAQLHELDPRATAQAAGLARAYGFEAPMPCSPVAAEAPSSSSAADDAGAVGAPTPWIGAGFVVLSIMFAIVACWPASSIRRNARWMALEQRDDEQGRGEAVLEQGDQPAYRTSAAGGGTSVPESM